MEKEYEKRFCGILMNHFRGKVNMHIFSDVEEIKKLSSTEPEGYLLDDKELAQELCLFTSRKVFCLCDEVGDELIDKKVIELDKYMDVGRIMGEIIAQIGVEIQQIYEHGDIRPKSRVIGIYGVSKCEYQIPFALTLGSILCERERVLVLDLQENSGLAEFGRPEDALGLEDLLYLTRTNQLDMISLQSAIGSVGSVDYIYPAENTEVFAEADDSIYEKLCQWIQEQAEYSMILVNFGGRFQGFFEMLTGCHQIYMMQGLGGLGRWREYEFIAELTRRGHTDVVDRLIKVEIPIMTGNISTCGSLVNQWRWDEFGEQIRKLSMRETFLIQEAKVG